ncbi:13318_t:CDS:2 [Entrophospora sp. SA101]|nr:11498_t:CDS:2 [Entrophospora sp. SA101]CAJ0899562.1 13318_t:CDS:2 [Entrophospora sp. SA101]
MTSRGAYFKEYNQKPERKKYLTQKSQKRYQQQKKGTGKIICPNCSTVSKQNELRILERELQVHQYNLDHPKEKLEEFEKKCLLKKIEIGKRKIGNCKDELEEITEAYENEKRELCQRLSYTKKDIPDLFLRNPEERIDPLTREGPEYNPYEIHVEEKTDDSLFFVWKPVERELESLDEKGEKVMIKGQYLALSNLILHHSTLGIGEICSCPSYEVYTSKNKFSLDYELKFDLYRLGRKEKDLRWHVKHDSIEVIDFKDVMAGQRATLYFLLSKRLFLETTETETEESKIPVKTIPHIQFKRVGKFDKEKKISRLRDDTLNDFLTEKGLWKEEMYHFRRTHIKAILYWREMKI